jgi:hypothetical protein
MIAFGSPINDHEAYRRYAEPGIRLVAEHDSELYPLAAVESACRSFNLLLETAARNDELEALVLLHPHVELTDTDFCRKVRQALRDPDVGVIGSVGATGVRSIAWWEGSVSSAPLVHRYHEHGGGELPAFTWARSDTSLGEVETVDGLLLVLSPWVVRNIRFDESLVLGHGYDLDFCLQVRAAGRKVIAADLRATYHRSLELIEDLEVWTEAHIRVAEKWDGQLRNGATDEATWKQRARRAEAEREAARAFAFSNALRLDARVLELERALAEKTGSLSWRVTAPLRWGNRLRRERWQRLRRGPGPESERTVS